MSDPLDTILALAADYRRWSHTSDQNGDATKSSRQERNAVALEAVARELSLARKRLRPVSKEYGDLSDLPETVLAQLNLARVDELEHQLRDIVAAADGSQIGLDPIIIELYRRHRVVQERKFVMNKLYRMAQKGIIESVDGKKGVYHLPKAESRDERKYKEPENSDDLDSDIPF